MKPAPFDYSAPTTVDEATVILAEHGDEAKPLAGGQSLVPLLALRLARFAHLVDLNDVAELAGVQRENGTLRVGAMTRQRAAERSEEVAAAVPLLARALPLIGHRQIRARGTVGGSIAHADPASELPAVALALDADLEVRSSRGSRTIAAADFLVSMWTTALEPDELLVAVRFPVWGPRSGFAVEEFARRDGDFAIAGAATGVQIDDAGTITRAAIGLFGMGLSSVRAATAETALIGSSVNDADLDDIGRAAVADAEPSDDLHASAAYRRRVGAHLVRVALARSLEEASRG